MTVRYIVMAQEIWGTNRGGNLKSQKIQKTRVIIQFLQIISVFQQCRGIWNADSNSCGANSLVFLR